MPDYFYNSSGGKFSKKEVVKSILDFILEDEKKLYNITIGTDSCLLADKKADFVTAVVIHRVGNGGRYFWRRGETGRYHTLRDRIIQEVLLSLDVAGQMLREMKNFSSSLRWTIEVHADVGSGGPTSTMIQEVVGMVRAHNFEVKTKPSSYAASSVADRYV